MKDRHRMPDIPDRVCIIGAGAIGTFLAARLAQHEEVTLVERNLITPRRQEVRITGILECQGEVDLSPHIVDADLVMIATKAIHLETVIPLLKDSIAPLIFWQNGLGINHLLKSQPDETQSAEQSLIRAFSWMGVVREAPYTVRCNAFSRIAIGLIQDGRHSNSSNLQKVRTALTQS